jgi:hypothetical protein
MWRGHAGAGEHVTQEAEAPARREVELQQAKLEQLRARPWWRRLLDPG